MKRTAPTAVPSAAAGALSARPAPFADCPWLPRRARAWPIDPPLTELTRALGRLTDDSQKSQELFSMVRSFGLKLKRSHSMTHAQTNTPTALDHALSTAMETPAARPRDRLTVVAWLATHAARNTAWRDALCVALASTLHAEGLPKGTAWDWDVLQDVAIWDRVVPSLPPTLDPMWSILLAGLHQGAPVAPNATAHWKAVLVGTAVLALGDRLDARTASAAHALWSGRETRDDPVKARQVDALLDRRALHAAVAAEPVAPAAGSAARSPRNKAAAPGTEPVRSSRRKM